jgi:lysozyme
MKLEDFLIKEEGDDSRHLSDGYVASTWDSLGHVWNIGPGLTHGVTRSTIWTPAQLQAAEDAEFAATRAAVTSLVKVSISENQRTALESLVYNVGIGGFAHSSVLRDVNRQDFADVPSAFREWNRAGGCVCKGLIKRREDEIRLWNHPDDIPAPSDLKTAKNVPQATRADDSLDTKGLQLALNELGASPTLVADGNFGPKTVAALRLYQRTNGLAPDGVCGSLTTTKIRTALAGGPSRPLSAAA